MKQLIKNINYKIAAILALLLGVMSVFAGSKVLFGVTVKAYNVLPWLIKYNVFLGLISIVVAYFIFCKKKNAQKSAIVILASHFSIFLYLKFISKTVASESVKAMIFRSVVWLVIVLLITIVPKILNTKKS